MWGIEGETPEEGEWPKRDAVPFCAELAAVQAEAREYAADQVGAKVEITAAMSCAGVQAWWGTPHDLDGVDGICRAIYRAMHAAAPVPLVSDAEIALIRERDEARAALAQSMKNGSRHAADWARAVLERDEAQAVAIEATNMCARLDARLMAADAVAAIRGGMSREWWEAYVIEREAPLHEQIAARDATIADLNARLALMADPDAGKKPEAPKPMPAQALAPPKGDQRRVGG